MKWTGPVILCTILAFVAGCYPPCERNGCEAIARPITRAAIQRGIAGVIASESDLVVNDCADCPFARAELKIWTTLLPVADLPQAQSIVKTMPSFTIDANHRYEQVLDPGDYLVCQLPSECAAIAVRQTDVVTVNVKGRYGPSSLLIFTPGSTVPRSDGIFKFSAFP